MKRFSLKYTLTASLLLIVHNGVSIIIVVIDKHGLLASTRQQQPNEQDKENCKARTDTRTSKTDVKCMPPIVRENEESMPLDQTQAAHKNSLRKAMMPMTMPAIASALSVLVDASTMRSQFSPCQPASQKHFHVPACTTHVPCTHGLLLQFASLMHKLVSLAGFE